MIRPRDSPTKKRISRIVNFAIPADHSVKFKESRKKGKCLDLARRPKNPSNMKVTVIPVVIGALGTVTEWLVQVREDFDVSERVNTI